MGNKWSEPFCCTKSLPGESFQVTQWENIPRKNSTYSLSWGDGVGGLVRPRQLVFEGQSTDEEQCHREKAPEIYRRSFFSIWLNITNQLLKIKWNLSQVDIYIYKPHLLLLLKYKSNNWWQYLNDNIN